MLFQNEQNFPNERMNCLVSNRKTYHVISDKIAISKTAQFKIWRHQIERISQIAAFVIMHFCSFSMQIGNYRVYATIPRNEFSKIDQDLQKNPTEASIVVYVYFPGFTDLWLDNFFDLTIWKFLFFSGFVFWFLFSAIVKVLRYFWDRNILWAKLPPISGRTDDLLRTIFGKFYVCPVNHLLENWMTA